MPFYAEAGGSLCTDSLNNCYYISKITEYPYYYIFYIFPIKNDRVFDYGSPLHFGDSLSYNDWRQILQEKIDGILNKNYTSVDDNLINNIDDISIYPNPADDFLYINPKDFIDYAISINNILGQKLITQKFYNTNEINRIDISKLPIGVYFVVFESSESRKAYPIIVR